LRQKALCEFVRGGVVPSNRWFALAILFIARLVLGLQFQSAGSVAPFLIRDFNISYAQIGMLESLVAVRDDAGVGVADKVVATNGLNPDRGSFIARRLVDWFALSPVISWRLELRTESAWAMGAFRGLGYCIALIGSR